MRNLASTNEIVVGFPAPSEAREPASQAAADAGLINILIVDDEPKNLAVLESILGDPHYRLVRAESAEQALIALLVDQFALLILDIRMPGLTGIELAQIIKERKKTAQIPIIFLTAYYNEDQHVLAGYGAGAVDYMQKPVNPDILRSKVAVFADLHRMQRELSAANDALLAEVSERRRTQAALHELNNTLEQRVAERTQALRASAAMLQTVTDNASVGLATVDRDYRYAFANPAYCRIFSLPDDSLGRRPAELLAPVYAEQIAPFLDRAFAGERISCEMNRPAASGTIGPPGHYSVVYEPERDGHGDIIGVVVVVFDIADRKRTEEHIRLLLSEVNHRSKNMLSVVSAIAQQMTADNQSEFVRRFAQRIQALAASHDLLARSQWKSIAVFDLVRAQLGHFEDLMERRITLDGPPLELTVSGAQCIGMVVNELATNAAKHGALSDQNGRVEIAWRVDEDKAEGCFTISWVERDGPPVAAPSHRGFGSTVIKSMAELSLDGAVELDFAPSGLTWRLACPATRILTPPHADALAVAT